MKGQGVTEYLVILAVVLVVALVLVGLLDWFPGIAGASREQQSATYWQGASPFSITAMKLSGTTATLTLVNRLSTKLNLTDVSFANSSLANVTTTQFNGGQEQTLSGTLGATCGAAGTPFEYATIVFTYDQSGINSIKQTGDKPLIGKCS